MRKLKLTHSEKRKAEWIRLVSSLKVPQHTRVGHDQPGKQKPASGVFASV